MAPHIERMQAEFDELIDRIEKLTAFIDGSPIFRGLGVTDQSLLHAQLGAMQAYRYILAERFARALA